MSPYPVLANRPIDQWKVTELKEELKRRKLTTKGLKDDLIRRLDEALRLERESAENEAHQPEGENAENEACQLEIEKAENEAHQLESKNFENEADNGFDNATLPVVDGTKTEFTGPAAEIVDEDASKTEKVDDVTMKVGSDDSSDALGQGKVLERDIVVEADPARAEDPVVCATTVETIITVETSTTVTEGVVSEEALGGQDLQNIGTQEEGRNSNNQLENEGSVPPQKDDIKDHMLDTSAPANQVSEVSPTLGSQVKSDSISTDSVSINEKIELKDNIIADNVKLELDVIKPEMVEPSSSNVVPVVGGSHPMDVEEPHEKRTTVERNDGNSSTDADMTMKNDNADIGYSEKLNLDRSSGDDSMEEDVLENKQINSKYDEGENKSEKTEVPLVKEESLVDIVGDGFSAEEKDTPVQSKSHPTVPAEKRKFNAGFSEQEVMTSNEPLKRQRRWNSESVKVPEPQSSNLTPTTTPKESFQPTGLKRSFSRSDSTVSEDVPKERVVPPSQKSPTNSLRIDRFLRPFTLKAVQELLGKTGSVTSFWMDHIKTHCYVTYLSVEEAIETRNAVYNLQWPPNGGRFLVAEFVDPQEVKSRLEAPPPTPTTPASTAPPAPPAPPAVSQPQPSPHLQVPRQQLPPPPSLPPPPPLSNPPPARERLPLPPPPPLPEKFDPPIVTLDDLFRKTKATPRIYYLPLSEEQVAAKLAARPKTIK